MFIYACVVGFRSFSLCIQTATWLTFLLQLGIKRLFLVSILSIVFSSCVFFVGDRSRAEHPVMSDTLGVVYVKTVGAGDAVNTYRIGAGALPIWCDVNEKYTNFLIDQSTSKKMFAVCYANKKTLLQEEPSFKVNAVVEHLEQKDGAVSIEELFNPFAKAYMFSVSIVPSKYDDFFVFYFDLYRNFCQKDGVSCSMTGSGSDFNFTMVIEEPENVKRLYMELYSLVTYTNNPRNGYSRTASLYGLFSSVVYDKCSFNRWYYDAVAAGVATPESFMDPEKWHQLEGKIRSARVKKIDIKLIDYQKISSEDKKWLGHSLQNLSERF